MYNGDNVIFTFARPVNATAREKFILLLRDTDERADHKLNYVNLDIICKKKYALNVPSLNV